MGKIIKEFSKIKIDQVDIRNLTSEDKHNLNYILHYSKDATIFHTIDWNRILIDEFNANNKTLIARTDGSPVGVYAFYNLKQYKFLRICRSPIYALESVYGGPIAVDNSDLVIKELLKESERIGRGMMYSMQTPPGYDTYSLTEMGYDTTVWYTSIVDLQKSEEELWNGLKGKARNMVRKAIKSGVNITEGNTSSVVDYYEMIKKTFARVGVTNLLPICFYESILKNLKPKNMVKMLLAEYNNKIIAGAIFLCFKDTVYYWHGASHREYSNVAPNDLIQWELIKWANEKGYKYYDLVRIEPNHLPGVAAFKMGWGGDTVEFYYAVKRTRIYKLLSKFKSVCMEAKKDHEGK